MRIVTFNVNGLRACVDKGFFGFLSGINADMVCLQETKMQPEQAEFTFGGYNAYWNSAVKKGYSGTLTLSKSQPLSVKNGIGIAEHDGEGRAIALEYDDFYLVNVYTPNAQHGLARLSYRMEWEDCFRKYLLALDARKPVILCGDLNVAHEEIDLKNPKTNRENPGFSPQERQKMTDLLGAGFADVFRQLYPDARDAYTWWSFRANARERNIGWRIDYIVVSQRLMGKVKNCEILANVMGSDHCPVLLDIF